MKNLKILAVLGLLVIGFDAMAGQPSSHEVFARLKSLEGDWRSAAGKTTVNYKLIANGTSVVETWTMSPGRQSMTVYTMDGDRIIATHYCPQGNAPRLELARSSADGTHHFEFLDGANLQVKGGSHEHAFSFRIESADNVIRSETYIANGATYDAKKDVGTTEAFLRIR